MNDPRYYYYYYYYFEYPSEAASLSRQRVSAGELRWLAGWLTEASFAANKKECFEDEVEGAPVTTSFKRCTNNDRSDSINAYGWLAGSLALRVLLAPPAGLAYYRLMHSNRAISSEIV